jgi:hypothetical protein
VKSALVNPRVRRVPSGTMGIAMPTLRKGFVNRVMPGGEPPVPYRARNDWGAAYSRARNDGSSKACRGECFHSVSEWDSERGRFVAP